jgi:DNA-binding MarR family transcriptional regulator
MLTRKHFQSFFVNYEGAPMTDRKKISMLTDHLGYWMRLVSNQVSYSFARKLESKGITTAEWVLMRVVYDYETLAPSRIAERMGMTRGAISKLADRLIDKNMLVRTENRDDKRGHSLSLTEEARRLLPELARIADENDQEFFRDLTAADRSRMEAALKKIADRRGFRNVPID